MLNNLVLTTLLTTGVALATPVCDAPNLQKQAENQVTNYSLTLGLQNTNTNTYGNQETGYLSYTGYDYETIRNYQNNNVAINVIASQYKTRMYNEIDDENCEFILNYTWYDTYGYYYSNATRVVNVFQIDAYNYNTNTNMTTNISVNLSPVEIWGDRYTVDEFYWIKNVYTTIEDWSQYIHRQATSFNGYKILESIEDINNNFYYNKKTNWILNQTRTDTTEIELQPNKTNYIVIVYTPCVKAKDNGTIVPNTYTTVPLYDDDALEVDTFTFTGTNIIPTGTYEVVDIPGLMWQILEMPFAFVSQAFNLTLFPGTPYQVNISNLFLSIIAIFVFVWIVGMLFKLKG